MNNLECIVVPLIIILLFAWIIHDSNQRRKKALEKILAAEGKILEAKKAYKSSLQSLKSSPDNADLREKTLTLGREYARIVREDGKETIFDEIALMNDINAVIGGLPIKRIEGKEKSAFDRLNELQKMKDQGLISEAEYNAKRSAILEDI